MSAKEGNIPDIIDGYAELSLKLLHPGSVRWVLVWAMLKRCLSIKHTASQFERSYRKGVRCSWNGDCKHNVSNVFSLQVSLS